MVFINNAIYGMTGGQMAPTSLLGMKTSTSPDRPDTGDSRVPIKIADMDRVVGRVCDVPAYLARTRRTPCANVAKKAPIKGLSLPRRKGMAAS